MRIISFVEGARPDSGGVGIASVPHICHALALRGHDVTLCISGNPMPAVNAVLGAEQDVLRRQHGGSLRVISFNAVGRWSFALHQLSQLLRPLRKVDFVLLHSLYSYAVLMGYLVARTRGCPYAVWPHGVLAPFQRRVSRRKKTIYDLIVAGRVLREASLLVYTARGEHREASDIRAKGAAVVVPLGVNCSEFARLPRKGEFRARYLSDKRGPIVLFVGRLNAKKGLDLVINATAIAAQNHPDISLALVGSGDPPQFEGQVRRWLRDSGMTARTIMTGMLLGEEKLSAFVDADVFVLPSHAENFGRAMFEAMACGVPVIVSDTLNLATEVARSGAGLAVPRNAVGVGRAIDDLLKDEGLRNRMGEAGQRLARSYSWETTGEVLEREIVGVLEVGKNGRAGYADLRHEAESSLKGPDSRSSRRRSVPRRPPYNVLIDNISPGLSTSTKAKGGMRRFILGLVQHLPALEPNWKFELLSPAWASPLGVPRKENFTLRSCRGVPRVRIGRVLYEHLLLSHVARGRGRSVYLGTCNVLPRGLRSPSLLVVQSLQCFSRPAEFPKLPGIYLRAEIPRSVREATRVLCFSAACKSEVTRRFGVPPDRISVAYHPCQYRPGALPEPNADMLQRVRASIGTRPTILCVSAYYPFKNHARLIRAFARVRRETPCKLVLLGAETHQVTLAYLRQIASQAGVLDDVLFVGHAHGDELAAFYSTASVMAMPSLDETFGHPIVEAMAWGCPVVTSDSGAMAEVAGDAAVLVDPESEENIAAGLSRALSDGALRNRLKLAGKARAALFTDENFYSAFLRELRLVVESAGEVFS